MSFFRDFESDS